MASSPAPPRAPPPPPPPRRARAARIPTAICPKFRWTRGGTSTCIRATANAKWWSCRSAQMEWKAAKATMPISTAAPSSGPQRRRSWRRQGGFTLIEIGLVLLIISVIVALVVPRFRDQSQAELISQTRRLATTFRFLQQEAILNGRVYRLNFDLDQQRYFVTSVEASEADVEGFAQEGGILGRNVAL